MRIRFSSVSAKHGEEKAVKYLKALAGQNPVVKRGNDERVQLTAAGEYSLSWPMLRNARVAQKGAPMEGCRGPGGGAGGTRCKLPPGRLIRARPGSSHFALSKEGRKGSGAVFASCPSRCESPSSASLKGLKRVVISPENYQDYKETPAVSGDF